MPGFFGIAEQLEGPPKLTADSLPRCESCGLFKHCNSPKMPFHGKGRRGILFVGDAPGQTDDEKGIPFSGSAGIRLWRTLNDLDFDLFKDGWVTNSIICHSTDSKSPTDKELIHCQPNLLRTIETCQPHTIVLLGGAACKSLLSWLGQSNAGAIQTWSGWNIPCQELNTWICPTFDPVYVEYMDKNPAVDLWFRKHLQRAISHRKRPWDRVPNFQSQIELIYDDNTVARWIDHAIKLGGTCSWDIETNMFKPDGSDATIVAASICWKGEKTIAFPWIGDVVPAMLRFLQSPLKKIGANIKFEHRWIKAKLGIDVQNWVFDTVEAAHILDSRTGVSGLKFQSFVLLGQPNYSADIEQFLQADHSRKPNRIREANLEKLLAYCGLDSLLTYKVAQIQKNTLAQ